MQVADTIDTYVYSASVTTVWEILWQCLSILIIVGVLAIGILTMIVMVRGIQALGLYMKKNKIR